MGSGGLASSPRCHWHGSCPWCRWNAAAKAFSEKETRSLMSECHATNLNRRLPAFDHMTAVALAEMGLALGRPGRALKQLADVAAHGLGTADPLIRIQALPAFAAASARAAQRDQAATAAANFENWFTAAGSTPESRAARPDPCPACPDGAGDDNFEQALRLHAASGRPFDRARTELSPRTIHAHLRSIYAKLGISSRSELQAADLDHLGPSPPHEDDLGRANAQNWTFWVKCAGHSAR
jgi:hypothetical protein